MNYYNENDPFAAAWLRELIKANLISQGEVDERDIRDVLPSDLTSYTQCHFFAGIGGWSYALRLAGWPDDRPVWTGSCPCQPFSAAGEGLGYADERDLWPDLYHILLQRKPQHFFAEQVASSSALGWFDRLQSDLEAAGYASMAADIGALSVGAPHQRNRLYVVAHPYATRLSRWCQTGTNVKNATNFPARTGFTQLLENVVPTFDWKHQPVLGGGVHGVPGRVGQLCGFGNAIVPQVAQAFIQAYLEAICE